MKRINAWQGLTAGLAVLGAVGLSNAQAQQESSRLKVVDAVALTGEEGSRQVKTIELSMDDGEVRVKVDGKEVDTSKIKRDGNRIVILGDDGKELKQFSVGPFAEGFDYTFGGNAWQLAPQMFGAAEGENPKVMLGIHMGEPGPALQKHLQLKDSATTIVNGVYEGLPAHDAGLGEFDIITEVDGDTPADAESIRKALAEKSAGDEVKFTVIQAGKRRTITVTLREFDREAMAQAKLLGRATDPLQRFRTGNWMSLMPNHDGQQMLVVPNWEVAPFEADQFKKQFAPMLEQRRRAGQGQGQGRQGVEGQLDRLDQRMADLEAMIEKLLKEQRKN